MDTIHKDLVIHHEMEGSNKLLPSIS
jgi:hypothetical protein